MTRKGNALNRLCPEPLAEVNNEDAAALGLKDGDYVKISSRRGSIKLKAALADRTGKGVVFVPFHFRYYRW